MFRQEFEVTTSGVLCSSSAAKLSSDSIAMAPLSGAERAALQGFFQTKRGTAAHPRRPGAHAVHASHVATLWTAPWGLGTDGRTGKRSIGVLSVWALACGEVGPPASRPVRRVSGGDGRRALVTWLGVLERLWRYRRHPEEPWSVGHHESRQLVSRHRASCRLDGALGTPWLLSF